MCAAWGAVPAWSPCSAGAAGAARAVTRAGVALVPLLDREDREVCFAMGTGSTETVETRMATVWVLKWKLEVGALLSINFFTTRA